jgi:hypothetical protein
VKLPVIPEVNESTSTIGVPVLRRYTRGPNTVNPPAFKAKEANTPLSASVTTIRKENAFLGMLVPLLLFYLF